MLTPIVDNDTKTDAEIREMYDMEPDDPSPETISVCSGWWRKQEDGTYNFFDWRF